MADIYPNPITNTLHIRCSETVNLTIYTIQGLLVTANKIEKEAIIPTAHWAAGTYIVRLQTEKGLSVKKVVKY